MSPIGLVHIYPSVPRNTDPRAVPPRAGSKRPSRLSADLSRLPRETPPCPIQPSAEVEAWCHRSVSSISTYLSRETLIRAPFHRARAPNVLVASQKASSGTRDPPCPTQSSAIQSTSDTAPGTPECQALSLRRAASRLKAAAACRLSRGTVVLCHGGPRGRGPHPALGPLPVSGTAFE